MNIFEMRELRDCNEMRIDWLLSFDVLHLYLTDIVDAHDKRRSLFIVG